jgi:hypothetical protein
MIAERNSVEEKRTLLAAIVGCQFASTIALAAAPDPGDQPVTFTDVSSSAGVEFTHHNGATQARFLFETMGSGAALFDYDNDTYLDLYVVDSARPAGDGEPGNRLFRNNRDGTFSDVTASAGVGDPGFGMGTCTADYDNDGSTDLYVTNFGSANVLYRNKGDGRFAKVTDVAGVGDMSRGASCAFADFDNDGDLDLYVVNYLDTAQVRKNVWRAHTRVVHPSNFDGAADTLYANNGDGTFTDVSRSAGVFNASGKGLGVVIGDYDDDGDADIFVANDTTPNFLYRNSGNGKFTDVGVASGFAFNGHGKAEAGMGIDLADYDNDGLLDIFVTNFDFETNTLYRNFGNGLLMDVTAISGLAADPGPYMGWGTQLFDFDNDGDKDVFIVNGHLQDNIHLFADGTTYAQHKQLYGNEGQGRFSDVTRQAGAGLGVETVSRGAAFGDYDNDGDIDIFIVNNGQRATLLRNDGGNQNRWLTVKTVGTRSNRDGIGARIRITVGSLQQTREVKSSSSYLSGSDIRTMFGLEDAAQVDELVIRWPSGTSQTLRNIASNQVLVVTEPDES